MHGQDGEYDGHRCYILREEDRPYECHYLKDLLEDRVARIDKMHEDKSYTYDTDDNYWCATCGSHSHKKGFRDRILLALRYG